MKHLLATAAAATMVAGSAFAGGYVAPVAEPEVIVAPAPIVSASDWTGFYAGAQYGTGSFDLDGDNFTNDRDMKGYGMHVGYLHDMGQFVLGGELDYNKLDIDDIDDKGDMTRLRARAGYDMGRFMPYVTLGAAKVSAEVGTLDISETAVSYGLGADFKVTDNFTVGAEYSKQDFSDISDIDGVDLDTDLIQLRAAYHF